VDLTAYADRELLSSFFVAMTAERIHPGVAPHGAQGLFCENLLSPWASLWLIQGKENRHKKQPITDLISAGAVSFELRLTWKKTGPAGIWSRVINIVYDSQPKNRSKNGPGG
jgi:hypothetical protein